MTIRLYASCAISILSLIVLRPAAPANQSVRATEASINGPADLAMDNHGHLFVLEMVTDQVRRIDLARGTISTVAGNGKSCCYKENSPATDVSLGFLRSLAVDSDGDIFVGGFKQIREVHTRTGLISTVAGDGESGETLDGAKALAAHFWEVDSLTLDAQGNLFFADGHQSKIFEIDAATSTVHTYAGSGKIGYTGDGRLAIDASFRFPDSIRTDLHDNVIVADFENCAIRRIDSQTHLINTIAATDTEQDCLAIGNSRPGPFPSNPTSDSVGNIYFVEGALDVVSKVSVGTSNIVTFAGNGKRGFSGDSGPAKDAELANPSGLAIDADGNVFISEFSNNRIRRVDARTGVITTVAGNGLPHRMDIQM